MEAIVAKIKKNSTTEIWVHLRDYQGRQFVDLREYFFDADEGVWQPTRKGIMIAPDLMPAVIDGTELLEEVTDMGVIAKIPKTKKQELQVGRRVFSGNQYCEIRLWYLDDDTDEFAPSGKGVTFRDELISQLVEGLREAEDQLSEA